MTVSIAAPGSEPGRENEDGSGDCIGEEYTPGGTGHAGTQVMVSSSDRSDAQAIKAIFRNTVNFLKIENVDFLEENQRGSRGFGLHHFGKCYRRDKKLLDWFGFAIAEGLVEDGFELAAGFLGVAALLLADASHLFADAAHLLAQFAFFFADE